jgi:hypothetical protein
MKKFKVGDRVKHWKWCGEIIGTRKPFYEVLWDGDSGPNGAVANTYGRCLGLMTENQLELVLGKIK